MNIMPDKMTHPHDRFFKKDMNPFLLTIIQILRKIELLDGRNLIETVVFYILSYGELNNKEAFFKRIQSELSSEIGENVMTIAEQLRLEGERRGEKRGRIQGERRGQIKGKLEVAEQLLLEGVDPVLIARAAKLPLEKIKELESNRHKN